MSAMFTRPWMRRAALAAVGCKLWLVSAQAVFAIGGAGHDDRLFLRLANTFLDGQWLGAYNQLTLAKGPAYSIFIAATVALGIPLPLAQHLLYLLACWLLVRAVRPLLHSDAWAFALYLILLWQPMTYQMTVLGRVMRQHLYVSATLLVFAGFAALYTRASAPLRVRVGWALLLGVAWGTVWLTREESVWILPGTALLSLVVLVRLLRPPGADATAGVSRFKLRGSRAWWRAAQPLGVAAAAAALPIVAVCTMNWRNYGWWGTVEFRAPEFLRAYGALGRIQMGPEMPRVPLTRAGREAAYDVSPAFAELRPFLEGEIGREGAVRSLHVTHLPPEEREMAGGWWMWALRDAVAHAGHASNAREALDFYQRLADEVNRACDEGLLPAGPPRATMLPRWQARYTDDLLAELPRYLGAVVFFVDFTAVTPPSIGTADQLRLFRDLTQWFLSPAPEAPVFDTPTSTIARSYRVQALGIVGQIARWCCVAVVIGGLLSWGTSAVLGLVRRRWPSFCWWLASAGFGTSLAIVLVNLLVHVTSFPQFSPGAFAQAYPLMILSAFMAGAELWNRRLQRLGTVPPARA